LLFGPRPRATQKPRRSCAPTIAPPLRLHTYFMTYPPGFLRDVRGVADHVDHNIRVRKHRHVTAFDLPHRGTHAFRRTALQLALAGGGLGWHDVPTPF